MRGGEEGKEGNEGNEGKHVKMRGGKCRDKDGKERKEGTETVETLCYVKCDKNSGDSVMS